MITRLAQCALPVLATALTLVPATLTGAAQQLPNCPPKNPKALAFISLDPGAYNNLRVTLEQYGKPVKFAYDEQFVYFVTCRDSVESIRNLPHVLSAQILNADYRDGYSIDVPADGYLPQLDAGSLWNVARSIDAPNYWDTGYFGQGIDVAVIDTGVSATNMFRTPDNKNKMQNRLIDGRDLSFDSSEASGGNAVNDGRDGFGHGTHIAGIIAGVSDLVDPVTHQRVKLPLDHPTNSDVHELARQAKKHFVGIAPAARILNVRVGANNGAVDVSQVIAGIDWVVQHKSDPVPGDRALNVKVLNLSFGTDGIQLHAHDPLQAALDNAWKKGIFVVVSAGNEADAKRTLMNPAYDPNIMAVGATDSKLTTYDNDDVIADFSSRGDGTRKVDIVAPGRSITSLADSGSVVSRAYPDGRVGVSYMKGSGTSQAAAVVSGAAALVLSHWPSLTPNQLKAVLVNGAGQISGTGPKAPITDRGVGRLDLARIWGAVDRVGHGIVPTQTFDPGLGDGTLEGSRGTYHIGYTDSDGIDHVLEGEVDVTGAPWDGHAWRALSWEGHAWRDEAWDGHAWRGGVWDGHAWRSLGWSGGFWLDGDWQGHAWRDFGWQ